MRGTARASSLPCDLAHLKDQILLGVQGRDGPCRSFAPTLTNILLPMELLPGPVGVQYTDMDLRSRENSRVHSFLISCLITCRNSTGLSQDVPGTLVPSALADNPAEPPGWEEKGSHRSQQGWDRTKSLQAFRVRKESGDLLQPAQTIRGKKLEQRAL